MTRTVVLLFGPPGAGKSTAARASGLDVYDRDDAQWGNLESRFKPAIAALGHDPDAHAVVIRSAPTASARQTSLVLARATHAWVMATPAQVCHHRVRTRGRGRSGEHAAVVSWWRRYDHGTDVPVWPGAWPDLEQASEIGQRLAQLQPVCASCGGRHRPQIPCWKKVQPQLSPLVMARDQHRCMIGDHGRPCGRRATTIDHIVPLMWGGDHQLTNLRAACRADNERRGALDTPYASTLTTIEAGPSTVSSRWR